MSDRQDSGVSTIEPEQKRQTHTATREKNAPKKQPRYHVVLLDDDHHTYEYVVTMLQALFGHPFHKGFQMAKQVDSAGRAVVLTTTMEHAELKRDQIHGYGPDALIAGCKGSMSAIIQPAEDDDD